MKAFILLCDRCALEGKRDVRAVHRVWIRTTLGGRTMRLDACEQHLAAIVGASSSSNGAAPVVPRRSSGGERVWSGRAGPGKARDAYNRALAYAAKHARFSFDDLAAAVNKDILPARLGVALKMLVEDEKLERYQMGIYQQPGFSMPQPATVELATAAASKLIKSRPGIRGPMAAALCGIESHKLWKATLAQLREQRLIKTKGDKSGMRIYPL